VEEETVEGVRNAEGGTKTGSGILVECGLRTLIPRRGDGTPGEVLDALGRRAGSMQVVL
jgi:hypothetical protein